jgi:hypothetical protein
MRTKNQHFHSTELKKYSIKSKLPPLKQNKHSWFISKCLHEQFDTYMVDILSLLARIIFLNVVSPRVACVNEGLSVASFIVGGFFNPLASAGADLFQKLHWVSGRFQYQCHYG